MKTTGRFLLGTALCCAVALSALAQENVPGKVYVAEVDGGVTFAVGGKINELKKGISLPVQGARIETAPGAHVILVYSNGTSIYISENTIVEIRKFVQKLFPKGVDTATNEPSISDTIVVVTQGTVIIVTNELATGTSMVYLTPQSQLKFRGKEVVIEAREQDTRIILVAGDATVTPLNAAPGNVGQVLHAWQLAVVTNSPGSIATAAETIQVTALDQNTLNAFALQIAAAERAQKIVVFESGPSEIQAKAVVPVNLPVPLTVSPSTLRTGG
jgi:hypothetical protein